MTLSARQVVGSIAVAFAFVTTSSVAKAQGVPDEFVITLERTSCFGECPVYSVSIDAGGNVVYDGKRFVRVEGRQTDRIPASRAARLLATAERIGFFELRDRYRTIRNPDGTETMVTDLPTTFVTITRGGKTKRVEDYIGAPEGLKELEQEIDDLARATRWIRIDEPTVRQLVRDGWAPSAKELADLLENALRYDEVTVVKALLEIGADPNGDSSAKSAPPLMMVRSAAAARALIEAGASPFAGTEGGGTPLRWAVHVAPEVTEVLVKAGVPVDQSDPDGRTALWYAACNGNAGVVRLLLNAGADPNPRPSGVSALQCVRQAAESARSRKPVSFGGKPPFVQDFDGVIAALEQALAKRKQR
jgi:hypothetical protein